MKNNSTIFLSLSIIVILLSVIISFAETTTTSCIRFQGSQPIGKIDTAKTEQECTQQGGRWVVLKTAAPTTTPPPAPAPQFKCTDTDNGVNLNVKGTVTISRDGKAETIETDKCDPENLNLVDEYFCLGPKEIDLSLIHI